MKQVMLKQTPVDHLHETIPILSLHRQCWSLVRAAVMEDVLSLPELWHQIVSTFL